MKQKVWILFLVIGLLFISGGVLYKILNQTNHEEKQEEKPKEDVRIVDASYSCKRKEESFDGEIEGTTMKFNYTNYYDFSYKEGEIVYGTTGVNYQFLDQVSFNSFKWSEKNSSTPPNQQKEDQEKLIKQYSWLIGIEKEEDSYDIEAYLEQLNKLGYTCEKFEE